MTDKSVNNEVLKIAEAASRLRISETHAYRLIEAGEWPGPVLRLGRVIRIPTRSIDRLVGAEQDVDERKRE